MKYVLYIDYVGSPRVEYQPLTAKNLADAILQSDARYDENTMYLMRIMEKAGKKYKLDTGVTAQDYVGIIDKRGGKWCEYQGEHIVSHVIAKWGDDYWLK